MRYTTVIDITELEAVWRNPNASRIYIYMALKAGYHDTDRDLLQISTRVLGYRLNMTHSTVRHALHVLEKSGLITRQGEMFLIKKWVLQDTITERPKTKRLQKLADEAAERQRQDQQRELERAIETAQRQKLEQEGKTPYMVYYESLMKLAEAGDEEAMKKVIKNRPQYERHKAAVESRIKNKKP